MSFEKITLTEANLNPFEKIGKDWVLLTAGDENNYNTMTASWGTMGVMWNKNIFMAVVRPSRFTYSLMENNDTFSVSMFGKNYREALSFCGSYSGKEGDKNEKVKELGLNMTMIDNTPAFDESEIVLVCKKLYVQPMDKAFYLDNALFETNGTQPLHTAFWGEIIGAYKKA
ncbi:MAG: flavin reductase [Oscillospiraceae bacterium]|nr:flavin reductase [Oscillospiraceae bacterium]